MKLADTPMLETLAFDAAKRQYNRQFDMAKLDRLIDPDGIHVINDMLIHTHKHGLLCEPHMRCLVLIKAKGTMAPIQAWLDIAMDNFNGLPEARPEKVAAQL